METWQAIDSVRVVRSFAARPLEADHLRRILDAGHLAGAAAAVALVGPKSRDRWDLGRAAQDMVLAAWDLGIGSVPATVYDFELASRLLGLPDDRECPYLLSFGYPADPEVLTRPNRPGGRKRLEEVVHDERWGARWMEEVR